MNRISTLRLFLNYYRFPLRNLAVIYSVVLIFIFFGSSLPLIHFPSFILPAHAANIMIALSPLAFKRADNELSVDALVPASTVWKWGFFSGVCLVAVPLFIYCGWVCLSVVFWWLDTEHSVWSIFTDTGSFGYYNIPVTVADIFSNLIMTITMMIVVLKVHRRVVLKGIIAVIGATFVYGILFSFVVFDISELTDFNNVRAFVESMQDFTRLRQILMMLILSFAWIGAGLVYIYQSLKNRQY